MFTNRPFPQFVALGLVGVLLSFGAQSGQSQNIRTPFPFTIATRDTSASRMLPLPESALAGSHGALHLSVDGHVLAKDGTRLRFFGTQLSNNAQFLTSTDARAVAARLHNLGFNAVRFISNDYFGTDDASFFSYLDAASKPNKSSYVVNPLQLAKFDTLLYELKRKGIYSFLTLNSNHKFTTTEGVVAADTMYANVVLAHILDPGAAALERAWARTLLLHVNPLTGIRYADDPAIAVVDLNEENSLYYYWTLDRLNYVDEQNKINRGKSTISFQHSRRLDSLYNQYLSKKYGSDAVLTASWQGTQPVSLNNLIDNGSFEDLTRFTQTWTFLSRGGTSAQPLIADGGIDSSTFVKIRIAAIGATPNAANITYTNLSGRISKDSLYELSFWARMTYDSVKNKGVSTRPISVTLSDLSSGTRSVSTAQTIDTGWKRYSFVFRSQITGLQNLVFSVGAALGDVSLDAIKLARKPETALAPGESLSTGSIKRATYHNIALLPYARIRDLVMFMDSLQQAYYTGVASMLHDSLHFAGLVNYSSGNSAYTLPDIYTISSGDVSELHSGWDFIGGRPGKPNADTSWMVRGNPMVKSKTAGTLLPMVANSRIGKAFYLGEYAEPWTNQNISEQLVLIPMYAALQDWDGIFFTPYAINRAELFADQFLNAYHQPTSVNSIANNSAVLALAPAASKIFLDGLQPVNDLADTILHDPSDVWLSPEFSGRGNIGVEGGLESNVATALLLRQHFNDYRHKRAAEYPYVADTFPKPSLDTMTTWTQSLGKFTAASNRFIAATGFFGAAETVIPQKLDAPFYFHLSRTDQASDILSMFMVAMDSARIDTSKDIFLTLSTRAQNSGLTWVDSNGFGANWGSAPLIMSAAKIQLSWKSPYDSVIVQPLDSSGNAHKAPYAFVSDILGMMTITLDQATDKTTWYRIRLKAFRGPSSVNSKPTEAVALFPNPARNSVTLRTYETIEVQLLDDLGRELLNRHLVPGATDLDLHGLLAGHYIVRLTSPAHTEIRHLAIIR